MSTTPDVSLSDAQRARRAARVLLPSTIYRDRRSPAFFLHMLPLDVVELPKFLIPAIDRRRPPLLRCGYPISDSFLRTSCQEGGYADEDEEEDLGYCNGTGYTDTRGGLLDIPGYCDEDRLMRYAPQIQIDLGKAIGYPQLEFHIVYGAPGAIIFEVRNNYALEHGASPEAVEQLRAKLGAEGPPKWYLDEEYPDWDHL